MNILEIFDPIGQFLTNDLKIYIILLRIVLAIMLAAFLGIERAQKRHAAGLRTFILVTLFTVSTAMIDVFLMANYNIIFPAISTAAVVGIAIISANTMLYSSRTGIKGLTTAVALWSSTFIGLTIGFGLYTVGLIGFILLVIVLNLLPNLETFLKNRSNFFEIHLELKNKTDLPKFMNVLRNLGLRIDDIETNPAYQNSGLAVFTISLTVTKDELKQYKTHKEIIEALHSLDYVNAIEELG